MSYRKFFSFLILIFSFSGQVSAEQCANEVCFKDTYSIDNHNFNLKGVATHRYFGYKLFTAGLYVLNKEASFESLGSEPVLLLLQYRRDFTPANFIDSSEKFMKKNPQISFDSVYPQWLEVNKLYRDVKENDRYGILYIPSKGIELYLNGTLTGKVSGDDFAKSYLSVWLSPWGLSESFAEKLWVKES